MTKSKKTDKTMVDEILYRKLKIGQPKAHWQFQNFRMSCSPSGTCCVTVKWQDYNSIWKSCWIWIPYKMGVKKNRTSYLDQDILKFWNCQWALGCPIFSFLYSISSTIVLSVFLLFVIILSVLWLWCLITPFGIFKLFLISTCNNYLNRC
jgi:hypothetical protein